MQTLTQNIYMSNALITIPWNRRVNIATFNSTLSPILSYKRAAHGGR